MAITPIKTTNYEQAFTVDASGNKVYTPQFTGETNQPMTQEAWTAQYGGLPNVNTTSQSTVNTTNRDPHINPSTGQWDDNYYASQQSNVPKVDEAAINAIYQPSIDYLGQAESNLRNDYPTVLSGLQSNYDVNAKMLSDQNTSGLQQIDTSALNATNRKESALASARRLYDELRKGYGQKFGKATSASEAATDIANVEQQRQMGLTTRSYGDTMMAIDYQKNDLQRNYATAQMKMKSDLDIARNQAQMDFQNKLLSIQQSKAGIYGARAAANLQALQEYKNQLYQINMQNTQFQQTLELQRNAAQMQIDAMVKNAALATQNATNASNGINPTIPNPYLNVTNTNNTTASQYTGTIFRGRYDKNGLPIYE